MRIAKSLSVAFVLAVLPLTAAADDLADCKAGWKAFEATMPSLGLPKSARLLDGWCHVDRIAATLDGGSGEVEIRQFYWRGAGVEAAVGAMALPRDFGLRATGIRLTPGSRNAAAGNALSASNRVEFDMSLAVVSHPSDGTLRIEGPNLAFQGENGLRVILDFAGIEPGDTAVSMAALGLANLSAATIEIASDGRAADQLFDLVGALGGREPVAWTRPRRDDALALLAALPHEKLDLSSRAAVTRLIEDMPRFKGTVSLTAVAEGSFPVTRILSFFGPLPAEDAAGVAKVFDGMKISVAYEE